MDSSSSSSEAQQPSSSSNSYTQRGPSHILQDGKWIYLPEVTDRSHFFERACAEQGVLTESNLKLPSAGQDTAEEGQQQKPELNQQEEEEENVHALALASAKLQSLGVQDLSKMINLSSLLQGSDQYFTLANIVNDTSALLSALAVEKKKIEMKVADGTLSGEHSKESAATISRQQTELLAQISTERVQEDKLKAAYMLKRKKDAYTNENHGVSTILRNHRDALQLSLKRQRLVDQRFLELSGRWKLTLPDHATKVLSAAKANDLVAIDLHVYGDDDDDDSRYDDNMTEEQSMNPLFVPKDNDEKRRHSGKDNLSSTVPSYATLEIDRNRANTITTISNHNDDDYMDIDDQQNNSNKASLTKAVPFVPFKSYSSRQDIDFSNVHELTLLVSVEKPSTELVQSVMSIDNNNNNSNDDDLVSGNNNNNDRNDDDESTIIRYQQSHFYVSLFDTIREEISNSQAELQTAWLSSDSKKSFLQPPNQMSGAADRSISIVHAQEGEVKVRLDSDYNLTVKLMEIDVAKEVCKNEVLNNSHHGPSSEELRKMRAICAALHLHAQHLFHTWSSATKSKHATSASEVAGKKKESDYHPKILAKCVGLGAKLITERKVKAMLNRLKVLALNNSSFRVVWLPLSEFEEHAHFVLSDDDDNSVSRFQLDCHITGSKIKIMKVTTGGSCSGVTFSSVNDFESYLKLQLLRD